MNYEQKDGKIRIIDASGIDENSWQQIFRLFNHLGYDLPNIQFAKEYVCRGNWLREDQSEAFLSVIEGKPLKQIGYSKEQIDADIKRAKKYFGITNDVALAGYLLIDGDLLDFSHDGIRCLDHRDIKDVLEDHSDGYNDPMDQFIAYGNARITSVGFEIQKPLTQAQISTLKNLIRYYRIENDGYMGIDISNGEGQVVENFTYSRPTVSEIVNDIDNYFKSLDLSYEEEPDFE